jgi:hypothetical protein
MSDHTLSIRSVLGGPAHARIGKGLSGGVSQVKSSDRLADGAQQTRINNIRLINTGKLLALIIKKSLKFS